MVPQVVGVLVAVVHLPGAAHLTVRPVLPRTANAMTVRRKSGVRPLRANLPRAGLSMTETAAVPGWLALGVTAPIVPVQVPARCSCPAT